MEKWLPLTDIPPNKLVQVIDKEGNTAYAYPTYYPFIIEKQPGDEFKQWGWRGTVVPTEEHWNGGWMISMALSRPLFNLKEIVGWRLITKNINHGNN